MRLRNKLLFLFLFAAASLTAQSFEGAITFQIHSAQQQGELELLLSPKGIRVEFKGQNNFVMLIKRDATDAIQLNPKTKTYRDIDLQEQRRLSASVGKLEKFEVEKLGKELVLNVVCHHFKLKSAKRTLEIWAAESLVDSTHLTRLIDVGTLVGISPNAIEVMQKENLNGLPLKVIVTEPSGSAQVEAKRIVRKSFKSSLFEVEKSYRKEENNAEMQ
jgi:hypothetical protein